MKRSILSFVIIGLLLLSSACGSNASSTANQTNATDNSSASETESPENEETTPEHQYVGEYQQEPVYQKLMQIESCTDPDALCQILEELYNEEFSYIKLECKSTNNPEADEYAGYEAPYEDFLCSFFADYNTFLGKSFITSDTYLFFKGYSEEPSFIMDCDGTYIVRKYEIVNFDDGTHCHSVMGAIISDFFLSSHGYIDEDAEAKAFWREYVRSCDWYMSFESLIVDSLDDNTRNNVSNANPEQDAASEITDTVTPTPEPVVETPLPQLNTETPYLETVERADYPIYEGPGYEYNFVQTVEVAGVYTIVEEAWGSEGHLWGRLKSGVGWIDLTENRSPANTQSMISANFADASLLSSGNYDHCVVDTSEYMVQFAFQAGVTLRDFCFTELHWGDYGYEIGELYYYAAEMTPERPLVVDGAFPGDMSMYGVSFTDPDGISRYYCVSTSGLDGSLVFSEYEN